MGNRDLDARQKIDGYDKLQKKLCCCEKELAAVKAECPPCPPHVPLVFLKEGEIALSEDGILEDCTYRVTISHFGVAFTVFETEGPKTLAEIVTELTAFFATLPFQFAFDEVDHNLQLTITSFYGAYDWNMVDELVCI